MNLIVGLYAIMTAISRWSESLRVAILVRIWGMSHAGKPPVDWRVREGLPSLDRWPTVRDANNMDRAVLVVGAVKAGPIRPVPAELELNLDTSVKKIDAQLGKVDGD